MSLNLRKSIVEQFWQGRDPRMARILLWMESMEEWGLDENEDFSEALLSLSPKLEQAGRGTMLEQSEALITVMAYMSAGRAMRMMEWFDEHFPKGLSIELIEQAQGQSEDAPAQLMLDRLRALESLSLLGKIFSPTRMRIISELLRETADEPPTHERL